MTGPRLTDDCIYESDAIDIGVSLFGEQTCSTCRTPLPANTDYFAPEKALPLGLAHRCRRCRRAEGRAAYAKKQRAQTVGD